MVSKTISGSRISTLQTNSNTAQQPTSPKIVIKQIFRPDNKISREIPIYNPEIKTVKPGGTVEQPVEENIDLNGYLVSHPTSTFLVKVAGEQAPHLGIFPGDLLVVDQTTSTRDGKMVVGILNNKFVIKFLKMKGTKLFFAADNANGSDSEILATTKFNLWGVVTYIIHKPELSTLDTPILSSEQ
jgi:DNA polymerase V